MHHYPSSAPIKVKVTFVSTRNKFGSSAICDAAVDHKFYERLSSVNKVLMRGWNEEKEAKQKKLAKAQFEKERLQNLNEFRRLAESTSLLSPYLKDCSGLKKLSEKLLNAIIPHSFHVSCSLDFWIWMDAQRYFYPTSSSSVDSSVLKLIDTDFQMLSNTWYTPLEDTEEDPVQNNESSNYDLGEMLQRSMAIMREVLNVDPSFDSEQIDISYNECKKTEEFIRKLEIEASLLSTTINRVIASIRKKTLETVDFCEEQDRANKASFVEGLILKRYNKAKKRKRTKAL